MLLYHTRAEKSQVRNESQALKLRSAPPEMKAAAHESRFGLGAGQRSLIFCHHLIKLQNGINFNFNHFGAPFDHHSPLCRSDHLPPRPALSFPARWSALHFPRLSLGSFEEYLHHDALHRYWPRYI